MTFVWAFAALLVLFGAIFVWFFTGIFLKAIVLLGPPVLVVLSTSFLGYVVGSFLGGVFAIGGFIGATVLYDRWEASDRYHEIEMKINARFFTK